MRKNTPVEFRMLRVPLTAAEVNRVLLAVASLEADGYLPIERGANPSTSQGGYAREDGVPVRAVIRSRGWVVTSSGVVTAEDAGIIHAGVWGTGLPLGVGDVASHDGVWTSDDKLIPMSPYAREALIWARAPWFPAWFRLLARARLFVDQPRFRVLTRLLVRDEEFRASAEATHTLGGDLALREWARDLRLP